MLIIDVHLYQFSYKWHIFPFVKIYLYQGTIIWIINLYLFDFPQKTYCNRSKTYRAEVHLNYFQSFQGIIHIVSLVLIHVLNVAFLENP